MVTAAAGMKVGSGFDPTSQLGPLVSRRHFNRVMEFMDGARKDGARTLVGGERMHDAGYFVKPTILVDTRDTMRVVQEEVFGPVAICIPFDNLETAVNQANDTPHGLAASVWSNDLSKVHRLIPRLKAGMVWVNTHNMLDANLPLGGFKQSGYGHDMGRAAVESYTALKSVCMAV